MGKGRVKVTDLKVLRMAKTQAGHGKLTLICASYLVDDEWEVRWGLISHWKSLLVNGDRDMNKAIAEYKKNPGP